MSGDEPITRKHFHEWYPGPADRRACQDAMLEALREHERREFVENEKRFDQLERDMQELKQFMSNIDTGRKVIMTVFAVAGSISALVIAAWPLLPSSRP